jgi:hypothetical protein
MHERVSALLEYIGIGTKCPFESLRTLREFNLQLHRLRPQGAQGYGPAQGRAKHIYRLQQREIHVYLLEKV